MKRIVAVFLCVTLGLSSFPVHVYAKTNFEEYNDEYLVDETREQADSDQGDLQTAVEKTFENVEYGYVLTVTPVDTEIELRSGTAVRYSLLPIDADKTVLGMKGVYGNIIVITVQTVTDSDMGTLSLGNTLFVRLDNGEVTTVLQGTDFTIYSVLPGTFREATDPYARYAVDSLEFTVNAHSVYAVCYDPDTVPSLMVIYKDGLYDLANTETGKYFDYNLADFRFATHKVNDMYEDIYIVDGVLFGYTDGPAHLRETIYISDTGEPLFPEDSQSQLLQDNLFFTVQDASGNYGVFDYTGKERIPCAYGWIVDFSSNTAIVREGGVGSYYYLVGEKNGAIVPLCDTETYVEISRFYSGVAIGHRLVYGYSGYEGGEGYYYETDDLIFEDGTVLDLAKLLGGKYASVHYEEDNYYNMFIDPSAIGVTVESYVEEEYFGWSTREDYELNFRGIISSKGEILHSFGEEFGYSTIGESVFIEIEGQESGERDIAKKTGGIISQLPDGATYQPVKEKYLMIQDPGAVNGYRSYIIDDAGTVVWGSAAEVSLSNNNDNILSPHILLRTDDATGVLFLEDMSFSGFIWENTFAYGISSDEGSVSEELLVLKDLSGMYSVLNAEGVIVSGLPYQPYVTPESYVLANVASYNTTYHGFELQSFDKNGTAAWPEGTYFSHSIINNFPGNTDYLYGIIVYTSDGFGYMAPDGHTIVTPENKDLIVLQPEPLLLAKTEADTSQLINATSGSIIAEVQKTNYGEISAEINNSAIRFRNAIENYIVYPKGTGDGGSEVDGSVVITSAPESIYLDGTGTIYAEYISSGGGIDAAQVLWETRDQAVLEVISTKVDGNRLSAVVKAKGEGTTEIAVRLSNGRSASTSIEVLPKPSTAFSHAELTPVCGNQNVLPNISLTNKFQISYDRDIELNQGYLLIYEYETDRLVEAISSSQAEFSGLREIEFNTQNPLSPNTKYYVLVDDGLVRDAQNLSEISRGIAQKDEWTFTTAGLDTYSKIITEEELFLQYPQFLNVDNLPDQVREEYLNIITSIDEYDRSVAAIFWGIDNLSTNALGTLLKAYQLKEDAEEHALYSILVSASENKDWTEHALLDTGKDAAGILSSISELAVPESSEDVMALLYDMYPVELGRMFPDFRKDQVVELLTRSDFDGIMGTAFPEIMHGTFKNTERVLTCTTVILDYLTVRQASIDIIDTFIAELERMGYTDYLYDQAKQVRHEIYEESVTTYVLREFVNSEVAKKIVSTVKEIAASKTGFSPNKLVECIVSLSGKGVASIYKQLAPSAEDLFDVYAYSMYMGRLYWMVETAKDRFLNFEADKEDIRAFQILYSLYIAALQGTGESIRKLDLNTWQQLRIQNQITELEKYSYGTYRDICLDYAQDYIVCIGSNLEYDIRDGKLYITGFPESTPVQGKMRTLLAAEEETLYLTSDSGKSSWLVIPEEIDGYPVAGIADYAFTGNTDLRSVYVAADLEYVGEKAFYGCTSLESINFSNGTQSIARDAFANNPNLKIASLATGDCIIEDTAFANCPSLQYIITDSMEVQFSDTATQNSPQVTIVGLKDSGAAQYANAVGLDFVSADPSIQTVQVAKLPNKIQYTVGEPLIMDGMVLDLELSDGTHQKVTDGWTTLGETDHVGTAKIVILYGAQSTEIEVTVVNDEDTNIDQGNQSSGGSGESVFPISTNATENGTITVTPVRASRGSIITVIAEADEGFILGSLRVFDQKGDEISLNKEGDKFTFIMPASKVSVEGKFVEREMNPFLDVEERDYFYNAVLWAMKNGVTRGTTDTTFSPDITCTRAQTITFLWRAAGSPHPQNTVNPFGDVNEDSYYYEAVLWAMENGITTGTSANSFSPDVSCTRGQVVTFLYRYHGMQATEGTYFSDVREDSYYYDAVQWAAQNEITAGTSASTFSPNADCTRAQIVTFLYRDFKE